MKQTYTARLDAAITEAREAIVDIAVLVLDTPEGGTLNDIRRSIARYTAFVAVRARLDALESPMPHMSDHRGSWPHEYDNGVHMNTCIACTKRRELTVEAERLLETQ